MQINKAIRQVMRDKSVTLLSMAKAIMRNRSYLPKLKLGVKIMARHIQLELETKSSMPMCSKQRQVPG